MADRDFDIIIYGASGYTGRLVAAYLNKRVRAGEAIKWAMAGRNVEKLSDVRGEIGAPESTQLIIADADDAASMAVMAKRAKVIITTVGPYQLYGEPLIKACVQAGTDYVDLCGETAWMRQMIDAYEAEAKTTGARIVFSCGFDSVPFDMGVWFLQETAKTTLGDALPRVKGRVRAMNGTFSGGTAASGRATMAAAARDPKILQWLLSPFSLTPGFEGVDQPPGNQPMEDPATGGWVAPFIMAAINTKNIHRSNFLMNHTYGKDFVYDEMIMTGPGEAGKAMAEVVAATDPMGGEDAPKPGEGPSKAEREAGNYDLLFIGEATDGQTLRASVQGDMDPGYGSTSKMISECALCLIRDVADLPGGIYTPAPAFGQAIIDRLAAHAGLTFTLEPPARVV